MLIQRRHRLIVMFLGLFLALTLTRPAFSEDEESSKSDDESTSQQESPPPPPPPPPRRQKLKTRSGRREYVTDVDHGDRSDAGVFHVGFAAGGNFYVEPKLLTTGTTQTITGEYYKDFGFQGGVYFDFDYSEIEQNIPLLLRGMIGYKYILNSTHVFTFDGVVRRQFRFSEKATFGLGLGGSAAVWYRAASTTPPLSSEQIIFLPSFILTFGFEFNPFMVDFKWLINKFGQDETVTGFELYFGFRL